MDQKQIPPPEPKRDKDDVGDPMGLFRKPLEVPNVDESIAKIDDILAAKVKKKKKRAIPELSCCGMLPCKGRTPICYMCDLCLDCITGAGCGHNNSRHKFTNKVTQMDPGEFFQEEVDE